MNHNKAPGPMFNTKMLAARWDTSPARLANLRSAGKGPRFVRIGARCLYRIEDILLHEAANTVETLS